MNGLLTLLIIALMATPFARDAITELHFRRLSLEERGEFIFYQRGNRPTRLIREWLEWDQLDSTEGVIDHSGLTDPIGFIDILHKEVALEAGNEVLIQLQNKWRDFENFVPRVVFFSIELNQWFISYSYYLPIRLGGFAPTIVLDGENGSIVKVFIR